MTKQLNNKQQVPKLWRFLIFCFLGVVIMYLFNIFILLFSDPMPCSMPGFPVLHCLPEFAQTHVHWVDDVIQPSYPSSPPYHPALNLSQHHGPLPVSQLFASDGQSFGTSTSVFPMNIQDWFPLGWTDLISLQSKGLSRVFSNTTVWKHQFFGAQPYFWSIHDHWKNHSFDYMDPGWQSNVSAF